jgi:hypothetical protein
MRKYARIICCDHCKKPIAPEELREALQIRFVFLDSGIIGARMDLCPRCVKTKPLGPMLKKRQAERVEPSENLQRFPAQRGKNKKRANDVELKLVVAK